MYLPNKLYSNIWTREWKTRNYACWLGFGTGPGTGSMFDPGAGGDSTVSPPSGILKVLCFGYQSTHASYTPNPNTYSIGSGFSCSPLAWVWLFKAIPLFWLLLCHWDLWLLVLMLWLFLLWPWLDPCWVFWHILSPFNTHHQLLLHFNPFGPEFLSRSLGVRIGISFFVGLDFTNNTQLRRTGGAMFFLFMFTFSFSSCSHQRHVIIHGIVKFGIDHLLKGFSKDIK